MTFPTHIPKLEPTAHRIQTGNITPTMHRIPTGNATPTMHMIPTTTNIKPTARTTRAVHTVHTQPAHPPPPPDNEVGDDDEDQNSEIHEYASPQYNLEDIQLADPTLGRITHRDSTHSTGSMSLSLHTWNVT